MATYDLENFCSDIKTILQNNLNAKLLSIAAEKNDGMTLAPIADGAYFFQELNEAAVNYDPYIVYAIEGVESIPSGGTSAMKPTLHVVLVLADQGQDPAGIGARMLRYQRAIKEVFENHWDETKNGTKLELQSMVPVSFTLMNSKHPYRAIGVAVTGFIP